MEVRMCVLGGGAVGKTAITINFVHNHFVEFYDPTIEDNYRRTVNVDGEMYLLDILDTAGQDDFAVLRDSYMRTAEAFVLVYDITSRDSFVEIQNIHRQLCVARDTNDIPLLVIGNKLDLASSRTVTGFEASEWSKCIGAAYLETSAKNRINIDEAFNTIVREIRSYKERKSGPQKKQVKKAKKCSLL